MSKKKISPAENGDSDALRSRAVDTVNESLYR